MTDQAANALENFRNIHDVMHEDVYNAIVKSGEATQQLLGSLLKLTEEQIHLQNQSQAALAAKDREIHEAKTELEEYKLSCEKILAERRGVDTYLRNAEEVVNKMFSVRPPRRDNPPSDGNA